MNHLGFFISHVNIMSEKKIFLFSIASYVSFQKIINLQRQVVL